MIPGLTQPVDAMGVLPEEVLMAHAHPDGFLCRGASEELLTAILTLSVACRVAFRFTCSPSVG